MYQDHVLFGTIIPNIIGMIKRAGRTDPVTDGITAEDTRGIRVDLRPRSHWQNLINKIFIFVILFLLGLGIYQRDNSYLEAESGMGYALGIIGGSMMLILLLYPLRKRWRAMDRFLSIKFWFRLHMTFGILGPIAILYHSSFSLGSMNSNVALICMLLVASSGLIGRYLYVKIHHGLYGARTRISEYQALAENRREVLVKVIPHGEKVIDDLKSIETMSMQHSYGLFHSLYLRRKTKAEITRIRKIVKKIFRHEYKKGNRLSRKAAKLIHRNIEDYFVTVKRATDLRVNERLFAWWHILHFPLFLMMLVTGIVHVFVVHMY